MTLTPGLLDALRAIDTPTICHANCVHSAEFSVDGLRPALGLYEGRR